MNSGSSPRRVRVERGVYRQPNGKYAVCFRHAGRLRFRTVGFDLELARRQREALIAAARRGRVPPLSPQLRFQTLVESWGERFQARVDAGERRQRTLEAHRYHLDRQLLPALARRRVSAISVDDVAALLAEMRSSRCSPKTCANALGTLQVIMRYARRNGWIASIPSISSSATSGRTLTTTPASIGSPGNPATARGLRAPRSADGRDRAVHGASHLGAARSRLGRR
jgi:hypothetical protein